MLKFGVLSNKIVLRGKVENNNFIVNKMSDPHSAFRGSRLGRGNPKTLTKNKKRGQNEFSVLFCPSEKVNLMPIAHPAPVIKLTF